MNKDSLNQEFINKLTNVFSSFNNGDFSNETVFTDKEKIQYSQLVENIEQAVAKQKNTLFLLNEVANGNYKLKVTEENKYDRLRNTLQHLIQRLRNVSEITEAISQGNTSLKVVAQGKNDVLAHSINKITEKFHSTHQESTNKIRGLDFQQYALDQHAIISIANIRGDITYVNNKFCTISGYSREELLGKNHRIVKSEEHSKEFYLSLWQTISNGKIWHGVIKNIKKNREYYWVDATIVPLIDEAGKPFKYISFRTDITKLKKFEKQLTNEKIKAQKAQQIADNANQAKSEFLSSMSHELRTPLNSILGFAQMLDFNPNEPLSINQKEQVDLITQGGEHLLALINDILNLSKIEAGKLELSMETVSLTEIVEECMPLISEMAEKRGITISIDNERELKVYADRIRLKQILLNLLSNAIKYNRENGCITINIKYQFENRIYIGVTDTGYGIPDNKLNQLFIAFSRLGAENSAIEGTGIGLVLSRAMVEQMGGSIGVQSTEGEGSTFWIELALANEISISSSDIKKFKLDKELDSLNGTLLYVEDNPQNLKLMTLFISYLKGIELIIAENGEDGLKLAKESRPDMIILDINLPGMSGIEILNILKSNQITSNLPVFALSAAVTNIDIQKAMDAGFLKYLSKPVQFDELTAVIKSVLGKKHE